MSDYAFDAESKLPVRCSTCSHGHFEGPRRAGDKTVLVVRCDEFDEFRSVDAEPRRPDCWVTLTQVEIMTDGVRTVPVIRRRQAWPEGRTGPASNEPWDNPVPPRQRL